MTKENTLEERIYSIENNKKKKSRNRNHRLFSMIAAPFLAAAISITGCYEDKIYRQITHTESLELNPSLKNGKIAFARKGLGTAEFQIYTIDEKGNENQLTNIDGHNLYPTWSPDGRHIYFYNILPEPDKEDENKIGREKYNLLKIPSSGGPYAIKSPHVEIIKSHDFVIPYPMKELDESDFQHFYFTPKGRKITTKPSNEKGTIYIDEKQVADSVGAEPSLSLDERVLITVKDKSLYRQELDGNKPPKQITKDRGYFCPNLIHDGVYKGNILSVRQDKGRYSFVLLDENGNIIAEKETPMRFISEATVSEDGREVYYKGVIHSRDLYKSKLEDLFGGRK